VIHCPDSKQQSTGRHFSLTHCPDSKQQSTGRHFSLTHCPDSKQQSTGRHFSLTHCPDSKQQSAGRHFSQTGVCFLYAKHTALRRKSQDWLAQNQDNVSEWSDMSTCGLLFRIRTMCQREMSTCGLLFNLRG
jgi:hypothetical protein